MEPLYRLFPRLSMGEECGNIVKKNARFREIRHMPDMVFQVHVGTLLINDDLEMNTSRAALARLRSSHSFSLL
jgi:hypothetical protein